ncbi:PREDICTED: probable ubiquitin-conjugating enzyme E2 24 [Tarenaya hassleriana]|uniref:probable ubiquitin-conjugating enzyme E2 24 n=1 Tax=Tarenaya hassleriana TaxID=28532 RepID=UPI00053C3ACF|nr:PREDICTED: probable ubiquitin-conjugating enzyme E2 24 [Tarenaya hassleriana]
MDLGLTDSDWDSSSDSGSSEHEEVEFSYGGQAQNIFSSLEDTIGKIDEFLSFERGFSYGDIVRPITEPSGQTGRVININMFVDLESIHGKVIKEVDTNELQKLRSISVSDYVVNGPWLGRIEKIIDSVSVILDDGSKCEVLACDQEKLVAIPPNLLEDSQYAYYPGQRVQVKLGHDPRSTKWLCGNWQENRVVGTVCTVEAGLVYVEWVASTVMECDQNLPAPPSMQDPKNLTLLPCFSHASWQLGDWCIHPTSSRCAIEPKSSNVAAFNLLNGHGISERGFERNTQNSNLNELFVIVKTKMKVDVMWQDGSCSTGMDSQQLIPVGVVNAHEFWPGQFVVEKEVSDSKRYGVVKVFNGKEQTVKVQWRRWAGKEARGCKYEQMEEIVSAYELLEHPDFGFCFSDVVFRALPEQKTHPYAEFSDMKQMQTDSLSCIGVVIGFKNGYVEVKWANGLTTAVAPYEIWKIEKSESSASSSVSLEENIQVLDQKTIRSDESSSVQQVQDPMKVALETGSSSYFLPKAAVGFIKNIAASLFGSQYSTSFISSLSCCHASEDGTESEVLVEETTELFNVSEPDPGELDTVSRIFPQMEGKEMSKTADSTVSDTGKNLDKFGQFDMVNDCSDHHFLSPRNGIAQSQVKRSWVKKVQQEWSILKADLPETIYVRVYEERMDLLRAAMVGASGTPYHDGLFFFDIMLPPQYPHEPPMVHYHSGGLRLNPNLYESGRVCLSLLNTWNGSGSEVWNPESSSVLQVLLSLQALVLNEKPYFNEAGYDKQMGRVEGEKNSVSYNENAFLLTCKSMIYSLRNPPKHFEGLVKEHFGKRSKYVLETCRAYMEGAPVGWTGNGEENSSSSSTGFKIMISKLYPKLADAFSEIGE